MVLALLVWDDIYVIETSLYWYILKINKVWKRRERKRKHIISLISMDHMVVAEMTRIYNMQDYWAYKIDWGVDLYKRLKNQSTQIGNF